MLVIRSQRVVLPEGEQAATLHIKDGVIERILEFDAEDPTGARMFNVPDLVVSPGIVDTHVHVNEPGRSEWEGFDTATRAAAAGGVTTIVDMPLNSIPATTTVRALYAKVAAARAQCHVDVGFWGGVVPGNAGELEALVDAGVRGFKCFLVPSGVDEFPAVTEQDLRLALPILAKRGVPLLVHAEIASRLRIESASRSPQSAIRGLSRLPPGGHGARRHPPADSSGGGVQGAAPHRARVVEGRRSTRSPPRKADWVSMTAETCPHYLTFAAEEIPDGATEFKCAPPIREAAHRAALWRGLESGALDAIVTDHSPAPPALKTPGDFARAWGGIASLELSLAAAWSSLGPRPRRRPRRELRRGRATPVGACRSRAMDERRARGAGRPRASGRGASPKGSTPTSSSGIRMRGSWSSPNNCISGTS